MRLLCFLLGIFMVQIACAKEAGPFNVASYNLRLNLPQDGTDAWPQRKDAVKSLIRYHEFDIFGTQEGLLDQLDDLAEMREYAYIGAGRDDGKHGGEHSAIFFRKNRFSLIRSGNFWLSQTPERPSLGWDAVCCKRIASWAKFRDLLTKQEFYFFSVHFDHEGAVARRESAKLMVKKIQEIAGTEPVVCAGDFNSTPETEQIQTMQTLLRDAYRISALPPYGPVGTFNGFKFNASTQERIDYVFVSPQIEVLKYGVLSDSTRQHYPSDHYPVVVKLVIH